MNNELVTLIYDGLSLRMPVRAGEVTLFLDGTYQARGPVTPNDLVALFEALEPPEGGRVWWKIFAMSTLFQNDESEAKRIRDAVRVQPNEWSIIKTPKMAAWILSTGLYKRVSVSIFNDFKAQLWDTQTDEPAKSPDASKLFNRIQDGEPFPSRDELNEVLGKNQAMR